MLKRDLSAARDVRQNVEEVALLGVDDPLHLRRLLFAEAFLC